MTSERDILEYVNYAEEDERLESRVQVHRGVEAAIWLRAYVKGGAKRGALDPLECDADTLLSLIDRGYLTFQDGWFTITPAGTATLALDDEAELTQDGSSLPPAAAPRSVSDRGGGRAGAMVGTLIRAARKARGWTQGALARRAGVSLGDVGNIERGMITRRTLQVARRLAEFLDIERDPPQEQTPRPWRWQGMKDKRSV